jgi:Flp pilus assembly protein TadD
MGVDYSLPVEAMGNTIRAAPMFNPILITAVSGLWPGRAPGDSIALQVLTEPGPQMWQALRRAHELARCGQRKMAFDIACELSQVQASRADWHDAVGTLLTHCEVPEKAAIHFGGAVQLKPQTPGHLYNLATAQRMIGDLQAAENTLNQVIALDPNDARAYCTLSDLRSFKQVAEAINGAR